MGDGGGRLWLFRAEWRPVRWSVCLPLLIFPCTIKSRSSLLAPANPGGPGKRAIKWLWCGGCGVMNVCNRSKQTILCHMLTIFVILQTHYLCDGTELFIFLLSVARFLILYCSLCASPLSVLLFHLFPLTVTFMQTILDYSPFIHLTLTQASLITECLTTDLHSFKTEFLLILNTRDS